MAIKNNVKIFVERVYERPSKKDGFRILVNRLWPRVITKSRAQVDLWMKEMAPSEKLRKWFHTDKEKILRNYMPNTKKSL